MGNKTMEIINEQFDPNNIIQIKNHLEKNTTPCNISGIIKDLIKENIILKKRLTIIEKELGL